MGSIPGLERFPGVGNTNSLQYSCLENSMDRGAWWVTVHGVAKNWTQHSVRVCVCVCVRTQTCARMLTHTHSSIWDINERDYRLKYGS